MEIFFDESGNTGAVKNNNNRLNYDNQRHFALCGLVFENNEDKEIIKRKYNLLKEDFNIQGELKGNSLLTRKHNELLNRFINEILDKTHFKISIYDKNFYILTRMVSVLSGFEHKNMYPLEFYQIASSLITENDEILLKYCQLEENIEPDKIKEFLEFLQNYSYTNVLNSNLSYMAETILKNELVDIVLDNLKGISKYIGTKSTNIVNLSTLSEFIFMLKYESKTNLSNEELSIYHDKIDGFSKVFQNELASFGINVSFIDSTDNTFIQIADNAASIFCKVINQTVSIFENKKEWDKDSEWTLELASKLINKVQIDNIKFTLPIQNWAISLCIKDMFQPSFSKDKRNNLHFNNFYFHNISKINYEINKSAGIDSQNIYDLLNR
ncbi:hypothetical protein BFRIG_01357 [Peribacillus frigoritolerans]|uniref:DUF3800 domain-containing protein n=1 Tax=Peribacillus frigoritolerans TaxID=450367 RepID=UPI0030D4A49E